jgi:hypothetical protein
MLILLDLNKRRKDHLNATSREATQQFLASLSTLTCLDKSYTNTDIEAIFQYIHDKRDSPCDKHL